MVEISMMSLIYSNNGDDVSECRFRRQPPVIDGNGRRRHVLHVRVLHVVEELGVGVDRLLFQVTDDPVSELGGGEVGEVSSGRGRRRCGVRFGRRDTGGGATAGNGAGGMPELGLRRVVRHAGAVGAMEDDAERKRGGERGG
ncbi:hypothetical protein U1Q18_006765 [Sarracenia purpurea var. burkii]